MDGFSQLDAVAAAQRIVLGCMPPPEQILSPLEAEVQRLKAGNATRLVIKARAYAEVKRLEEAARAWMIKTDQELPLSLVFSIDPVKPMLLDHPTLSLSYKSWDDLIESIAKDIVDSRHMLGLAPPIETTSDHVVSEGRALLVQLQESRSRYRAAQPVDEPASGIDTYEDAIQMLRAIKRLPEQRKKLGDPPSQIDTAITPLWQIAVARARELAPDSNTYRRDLTRAMMCRPRRTQRVADRSAAP